MAPRTKAALTETATTIIELAGLGAITFGISLLSVAAAWIFAGIGAIAVSFFIVRSTPWSAGRR